MISNACACYILNIHASVGSNKGQPEGIDGMDGVVVGILMLRVGHILYKLVPEAIQLVMY